MNKFWEPSTEAGRDFIDVLSKPSADYYNKMVESIKGDWDDLQDLVNIQLAMNKLSTEVNRAIMNFYGNTPEPFKILKQSIGQNEIVLKQTLVDSYQNTRYYALTWDEEQFAFWYWEEGEWKLHSTFAEESHKNWGYMMGLMADKFKEDCL